MVKSKQNHPQTQPDGKSFQEQTKCKIQYALSCLIECSRDFQDEISRQESRGRNAVFLELPVAEFIAAELFRNCEIIHQGLSDLAHHQKLSDINLGAWIELLGSEPGTSQKEEAA